MPLSVSTLTLKHRVHELVAEVMVVDVVLRRRDVAVDDRLALAGVSLLVVRRDDQHLGLDRADRRERRLLRKLFDDREPSHGVLLESQSFDPCGSLRLLVKPIRPPSRVESTAPYWRPVARSMNTPLTLPIATGTFVWGFTASATICLRSS